MAKTTKTADKTEDDTLDSQEVINNQMSIPRGKPKSGRVWKSVRTQRHSAMRIGKILKTSWEVKMAKKQDTERYKERVQNIKDEKAKEKQRQRKMMEENRKRKLENERKSEIVQVIKDTSKIKRMKKKQLRSIEIR